MPTKSEILDTLPPQDLDAERRVLAACYRYPATPDKLDLRPEEFYSPLHAAMWIGFQGMRERREPVDENTVAEMIKRENIEAAVAGEVFVLGFGLLGIESYVPFYAEQVRKAYQRRTIIRAATEMLTDAYDGLNSVEDLLAGCEKMLAEIATGKFSNEPIDIADSTRMALEEVDAILSRTKHCGCMTGFKAFDEQVGGFFKGELAILAARPGIGKTSMALQMGFHAAQHGRRVYFASLEMSHVELATKLLCSLSGVSNQKVRNAKIEQIDCRLLVDAGCEVSKVDMKIHDWPSIRVYDIRRAARAMKADFVIVDYLQLVSPSDRTMKRYEQVAQLAKDLKAMARELDVPVLALAQLNRAIDQRGAEIRPRMSSLRESGDIEQTADMVLLLSRPKSGYSSKGEHSERWAAEMEVAKNRKGATPTFRMNWDERRTLYADWKDEF